ncbi:MAG: AlpA family phage regulatory protein [Rubrivivax sp.]|jgi:prophage regulatory protein|nr:AlpA family phage regulatory protein [Rubrivivax sp.]
MHLVTPKPQAAQPQRDKLIPIAGVEELTGFKSSKLYALIRLRQFPAPIKLGTRTARWPESKVLAWVQAQVRAAEQVELQQ